MPEARPSSRENSLGCTTLTCPEHNENVLFGQYERSQVRTTFAGTALEAAADQAIAACGGDAREAVKALIVANEFLEAQISQGYVGGVKHGRFGCYSG